MAQNLATKFSKQIDERFSQKSLTQGFFNKAYDMDFVGADTVEVLSVDTVAMGDYTIAGSNRFGAPTELNDTKQTIKMTKKRSCAFTIDTTVNAAQMFAKVLPTRINAQLDEVVFPEIDAHVFAKALAGAGTKKATLATKDNAYELVLDANAALAEEKVPLANRVLYVSPTFYKLLKLDPAFIKASDLAQGQIAFQGQLGMVDGLPVVIATQAMLGSKVQFMVIHRSAIVNPIKTSIINIHDNPPGIAGWLVEMLFVYDAEVLNSKKKGIYVSTSA